tara:strand:+ start:463 stop:1401 length:939 start_codon:yes stop_codon:yes gene_type:complete
MRVTVIGSINSDIVISVDRFAMSNETVIGQSDYVLAQGGKGANQAVAAAAAGAAVTMVGCVGGDSFGQSALADLESHGVDCRYVRTIPDATTGMASVIVDSDGNNMIVVAPGANSRLTVEAVQAAEELIANSDVVLLQLEVPLPTVAEAVRIARSHGVRVILNPAPASVKLPAWLSDLDIIIPNQHELKVLSDGAATAEEGSATLLDAGVGMVIVTLGGDGCLLSKPGWQQRIAPYKVDAVDTTGAGDIFCGFLAALIAGGASIQSAVEAANAAAAISVTRSNARKNIPTKQDVDQFMSRHEPVLADGLVQS